MLYVITGEMFEPKIFRKSTNIQYCGCIII